MKILARITKTLCRLRFWLISMIKTKEHTVALGQLSENMQIRKKILFLESEMLKIPGVIIGDNDICPLKHTFVDGAYVREMFMPKGMLIVGKIHKKLHPFFVLKGDVSVVTEEGMKRIKAPYFGVTPVGTKRVLYSHEDTVCITVHVTKETDLEKIEEEIIAKTYDEVNLPAFVNKVLKLTGA